MTRLRDRLTFLALLGFWCAVPVWLLAIGAAAP